MRVRVKLRYCLLLIILTCTECLGQQQQQKTMLQIPVHILLSKPIFQNRVPSHPSPVLPGAFRPVFSHEQDNQHKTLPHCQSVSAWQPGHDPWTLQRVLPMRKLSLCCSCYFYADRTLSDWKGHPMWKFQLLINDHICVSDRILT